MWIGLSSLLGILALRLDLYMLNYFGKTADAGIYAAAFQLAFAFPILTISLSTQLFPKAAGLYQRSDQQKYVYKILRFAPYVLAGALLIACFADFLIPLIFGEKYRSAVTPFIILQSVFMCGMIFTPLGLLVHARKQPYILTIMIVIQIAINGALDVILIPAYGATGAAWGTFGRYIAGFIFMSAWIWYTVMRNENAKTSMSYDEP
jgi:O-antigen/teichoic acid export membrane protein